MVGPAVDPVHHDGQVLAQLVGQILIDDAADDGLFGRPVMDLEGQRVALQAIGLQRLVHVADDVAALAHLAQGRLHALAQFPNARRVLGRQPHLVQLGETAQAKRPVELAARLGRLLAKVEEPIVGFLDHSPVDAGETVLVDLGRQLAGLLDLGDGAKLQRGQFARPLADAVGEIVAVDDKVLAQVILAAHDDMHMGMAGVVVIDRNPIEFRAKVGFHLAHEVAGIGCQVRQVRAVLRRDDESELVAILLAALKECSAIGAVLGRRIELPALAVARCAVALDVAQMGGRPSVPARLLDVAGLDDDAAHSGRAVTPAARQGASAHEGRAASAPDARSSSRARALAALGGRGLAWARRRSG